LTSELSEMACKGKLLKTTAVSISSSTDEKKCIVVTLRQNTHRITGCMHLQQAEERCLGTTHLYTINIQLVADGGLQ